MFNQLMTKTNLTILKITDAHDRVLARLQARATDGPDLTSNEGVSAEALWTFIAVGAVALLASLVLVPLYNAVLLKGNTAVTNVNGLPW